MVTLLRKEQESRIAVAANDGELMSVMRLSKSKIFKVSPLRMILRGTVLELPSA